MDTTITNAIPTTLNDILVKLRILSMIEVNRKINVADMTFVGKSSWFGSFYRSINGEGRRSLMLYLNQTIAQAIDAIAEYHNTEFCKIIVNHLAQAKIGINNLATTYQKDFATVAQIRVCMANIDIQLDKHKILLDGHYVKPENPIKTENPIKSENIKK